ncbi:Exocyst complex component [Caligus rogercresseyi]|uniref:Exocyst complex component 6 n=1 Tax=Caligus rogercresseyi TaxID=217165 RepID=A0A7T8QVG8_CALRO|nr:Exocyst complex component [Caligus rogercresseyi]
MEANHIARLQGRSMFKDIRAEAEDQINCKLISKMDEFIELANYDWLLPEAHGVSSPWLMDLIAFLKSVFQSFTNLPEKLAQMSCMSACQHLAKSIMEMILDESVKSISSGILSQIDLDVVQCEMFAASEPVRGLEVRNKRPEAYRINKVETKD